MALILPLCSIGGGSKMPNLIKKILKKIVLKPNKKRLFLINLLGFLVVTGGLLTWGLTRYSADTNSSSSLEQLQATPKPNFKSGNTLPPLSRGGWSIPYLVSKELADNWGYALQLVVNEDTIDNIDNHPTSNDAKIVALANSDPAKYPLQVSQRNYLTSAEIDALPESTWTHTDSPGTVRTRTRTLWSSSADVPLGTLRQYAIPSDPAHGFVYKCIQSVGSKDNAPVPGGNAWWVEATDAELDASPGKRLWSPAAPTSTSTGIAEIWADSYRALLSRYPNLNIPIVLNGGEYGLNVIGDSLNYWKQDPVVLAAEGSDSVGGESTISKWFDYVSAQKARQELAVSTVMRAAIPNHEIYEYYTTAAANSRLVGNVIWKKWAFDYPTIRSISDLPNAQEYYLWNGDYTGDWTNNIITGMLNQTAQQIAAGDPLSYNWLAGGWRLEQDGIWTAGADVPLNTIRVLNGQTYKCILALGSGINSPVPSGNAWWLPVEDFPGSGLDRKVSDSEHWMGFLKCYYTAGMIGGNVGYYWLSKEDDPNWINQLVVSGNAQALFSWLEDYLREGSLLPGPNKHAASTDLPAYEFPNTANDKNLHVLARKLNNDNKWIVTAFAASGIDRNVTVTIPTLGQITVNARVAGSVYTAKLDGDGKPVLTLIDIDAMNPTDGISARVDDGETPPAPILNLPRNFTYKQKTTISGTKSNKVKKVLINNVEAIIDNNNDTWTMEKDLVFGTNTITILGQDQAGNASSTVTRTITRRKVGDFNNDTKIDASDFTLLLFNWGSVLKNNFGDFNEDGKVDGSDFTLMLYWWGK